MTMSNAQAFDKDTEEFCKREFWMQPVDVLLKHKSRYKSALRRAEKSRDRANNVRFNFDAYASRARITKANAVYHSAAEEFERVTKYLAYINAQLRFVHTAVPWKPDAPSHDALFDGSDAHLLNDAGDAFEPTQDPAEDMK